MFRSTRRPIVFPQAEHARLAGTLALRWGNNCFSQPLSSHLDLVLGVTTHDRGFDALDADQIGQMSDERWVELARAGFARETLSDDQCDAADRVMGLCDWIAYDFCLERPARGAIGVRPSPGALTVEVTYVVDGFGGIEVDPWPFAIDALDGFALGFEASGYPDRATPVIVPFTASPAV